MGEIRLNSSKLGTQEYWNQFYQREIKNFEDNEEDTGECWFDDSDAESKMIQFLVDKINSQDISDTKLSFLDLGTGNGHLLFQMHEEFLEELEVELDYELKGIDYSPDSVAFASEIQQRKYPDEKFSFDQVDLLKKQNEFLQKHSGKYDILLDKGTLDAIALNQDPLPEFDNKIGQDVYPMQVKQLMHEGSILLITSCNFTEEELVKIITAEPDLKVWDKITYPTFRFGGAQGSTICSIAFIRSL